MRIKALKAYIKLVENHCNFGIHKILGIPRSTLWGYVNEIEKETELILVSRQKQNTVLTEEGKAFYPYALEVVQNFEEGVIQARANNTISVQIIISMTIAVCHSWFIQSIQGFSKLFPRLTIRAIVDDALSKEVLQTADIFLRPMDDDHVGAFEEKWHIEHKHFLFASQEYLKNYGVPRKPEDLLNDHLITSYGENTFYGFPDINWHINGQWGIPTLKPTLTINSTAAAYTAAKSNLGISSLPTGSVLATKDEKTNYLVRILPKISGPTTKTKCVVRPTTHVETRRNIDAFCDFFRFYLAERNVLTTS